MSRELFDKDDTDLDGSDETSTVRDVKRATNKVLHYVNDTDVDVTYTLQGTYDEDDFTDAVDLVSTTVTSGGSPDYDTLNSDVWEQLRVKLTFTSNPSSGSTQVRLMED